MFTYVHAHMHLQGSHMRTRTYVYTCIHTCVHMHTYMSILLAYSVLEPPGFLGADREWEHMLKAGGAPQTESTESGLRDPIQPECLLAMLMKTSAKSPSRWTKLCLLFRHVFLRAE